MRRSFRTWRVCACLGAWIVASAVWCASAVQADPIFHSTIQAVNQNGASTWAPGEPGTVLEGIVINNPWEMLDYSNAAASPQWQMFIQAVASGDYGGTALYMRREKPFPGHSGSLPYTPEEWDAEMDRLNFPAGATPQVQRGDRIQVVAGAPGLFFNGKFNINEQHSKDPLKDFSITILERGLTPLASLISLTDVKDGNDEFIFDQARLTGAEHYQGSLVRLEGLTLDDPQNWALNGKLTVRQGNLTMPLQLGLDPTLLSVDTLAMQSLGFSLTAIMDQEDANSSDGYRQGYRLWLTNAGDLDVVPEPGTLLLVLLGAVCAIPITRKCWRSRTA